MEPTEGSRVVCLVSDANPTSYPHNKPWEFTNVFPVPVTDRSDRRFTLRVCSAVLSASLIVAYRQHARLIINISGIEPQADGRSYTQRTAAFPLAEAVAQYGPTATLSADALGVRYHEHVFRQSPRLPLKFQILQKLTITITTEDGNVASIAGVETIFPTIVMLELEEDEQDQRQFTVTCRSHSAGGLYAANELSNFITPLPTEVELKDYEVALQSIVYPPELREDLAPITLTFNQHVLDFTVTADLEDTHNFLQLVRTSMAAIPVLSTISLNVLDDGSVEIRRRRFQAGNHGPLVMLVSCSFNFAVAIGGPGSRQLLPRTPLRYGTGIRFGGRPNITRLAPFSVAMLECDIVTPNIVGGRRANLLQVIPVLHRRKSGATRLYEPAELLFQPVDEIPFSQIRMRFTHPDGTQRHFHTFATAGQHAMIVLTLVFRKRSMYR